MKSESEPLSDLLVNNTVGWRLALLHVAPERAALGCATAMLWQEDKHRLLDRKSRDACFFPRMDEENVFTSLMKDCGCGRHLPGSGRRACSS